MKREETILKTFHGAGSNTLEPCPIEKNVKSILFQVLLP